MCLNILNALSVCQNYIHTDLDLILYTILESAYLIYLELVKYTYIGVRGR